jgi:CRISPR-associated endonuclease Csn1
MDSAFDFLFSLFPYDYVRIVTATGDERIGYYRACNVNTGSLTLSITNKNDALMRSIGVRTAISMEKFEVGVLGDIHKVGKETRVGLANGGNLQSGEADD